MKNKKPKRIVPLDKKIKNNFILFTIGAAFHIIGSLSFLGKIIPLPTELTLLSLANAVPTILFLVASISLKKCDPIFKKSFIYSIIYISLSFASFVFFIISDNDVFKVVEDSLDESSDIIFLIIVLFTIWNAREYLISKGSIKYVEKGYFLALIIIQAVIFSLSIFLSLNFLVSNYFIAITSIYLERLLTLSFAILVFIAFIRTLIYLGKIKKEEDSHGQES